MLIAQMQSFGLFSQAGGFDATTTTAMAIATTMVKTMQTDAGTVATREANGKKEADNEASRFEIQKMLIAQMQSFDLFSQAGGFDATTTTAMAYIERQVSSQPGKVVATCINQREREKDSKRQRDR